MMASMGSVVGEKLTRLFEYATEKGLPVVLFTCSGGARMQEACFAAADGQGVRGGAPSLGRRTAVYHRADRPDHGRCYRVVRHAGRYYPRGAAHDHRFAGRRVIEGTIGQTLPDDFQSSEFLLSHGFCDKIVPRNQLRETLEKLLKLHCGSKSKKWQVWRRD